MPQFWENFPKGIEADKRGFTLQLFPTETELQGGEQKTHTFYVAFGKDTITDEPMVWCRSPITFHASPEWYAASGAIEYLTPKASDPHAKYLALVDQAIDGPDTFLTKRETLRHVDGATAAFDPHRVERGSHGRQIGRAHV